MALSNLVVKQTYAANGVTTNFAIPFAVISDDSAETKVYVRDESDDPPTEELQTEGALQDYTLTGASPPTTPFDTTVVFNTAPASGLKVVIVRQLPLTQVLDLTANGQLNAESLELALDRLTAQIQQLDEKLSRTPKLPITEQLADLELPEPGDGKLFGWSSDGTEIELYSAEDLVVVAEGSLSDVIADLAAHLADTSDAHDASAISNTPAGTIVATDVQSAINELSGDIGTVSTGLSNHIGDSSAAHAASAISNTPAGTIAATDVQAAINELDGDISGHVGDSSAAHAASAISNTPAGTISATDVQAAINELDGDVSGHIGDTSGAHAATAISYDNGDSGLTATDVQDAIDELAASSGAGSGSIVQEVYAELTSSSTASGTIPFDNSIPQSSEGAEILTCSITPTNASNYLLVEAVVYIGEETNLADSLACALFRDSGADAIAADFHNDANAGSAGAGISLAGMRIRKRVTAGSTSETTFKIRAGLDNNNTFRINGANGTQYFGGALTTCITIREIAA